MICIDLFLEGFFSKKVFTSVVNCIANDAYGKEEIQSEAEALCQLPPHYLLGLFTYFKKTLKEDKKIEKTDSQFEANMGKLLDCLNFNSIFQHFQEIHGKFSQPITNEEPPKIPDTKNLRLLCTVGVSILQLYNLFQTFIKPKEIHNIQSLLDVAGVIKSIPKTVMSSTPISCNKPFFKRPVPLNEGSKCCLLKSYEFDLPEDQVKKKNELYENICKFHYF